jgi:PP-loop superfamily ATP-utilizing enzyme
VAWAPIQSDVRTVEVKPKSDPKELAYAHWGYVRELLEAHEETDAVIERCGFHYVSAFLHGYKHALEDIGHGSPDA